MKQPDLTRLDGIVTTIQYTRDDFTVAEVELLAERTRLPIVGDLAGIEEGQRVSLYGQRVRHPRYGEQFRVTFFHTLLEQTRAGIQAFLQHEVPGVGPSYAERIVGHFYSLYGEAMLERLQDEPDQLQEVPGLGQKRVAAIAGALRESYGSRRLLLALYRDGMSPKLARHVQRYYQERGVDPLRVFEETPYQMVHDVPGLGFETIDRIAQARGVPPDDEGRLAAAITHVLRRAFHRDGHFYLPPAPLIREVTSIIWPHDPPPHHADRIGDALERLRNQRYVQIVEVDETLAFYARTPWLVEEGLATHLLRLLEAPVPPLQYLDADPDALRRRAEDRAGLTLDPAQREAFHHALAHNVCIVTGGPGTGKSTLARLIVDTWEAAGLTVKLAAPTGRAARRLTETTGRAATTIHRLLVWHAGDFQHTEAWPLDGDALLIDESSMLDGPLAHALCRAVPSGMRLLFMGDVDQLPSVGPGNVLRDLISSEQLPVARLTHIHRQDTSQENLIVTLAHAVNHAPPGQSIPGGPIFARHPGAGNVFFFDVRQPWARCSCGGVRLPRLCPACRGGSVVAPIPPAARGAEMVQHLVTERIPATFGVASTDVQVIAPRYGGELGVNVLNERLRRTMNPPHPRRAEVHLGEHHFRVGDRVMAVRNNYDKDVVNGLQGYVVDADPKERLVTVDFDDEVQASFKREELEDLTLAYAITAHKSQGNEFPVVLLALDQSAGPLLYRQLLYTAISRARQLLVIVGDPAAVARATANDEPRHRWTGLAWWLASWRETGGPH